jgi:two-component system OmpR family response regulator
MKFFWKRAAEAPKEESPPVVPRGRILVVDDDVTTCRLLSQLLTKEGFTVAIATDGADAIVEAKRFVPDAMLLDLMLPSPDPGGAQLDGFGILRWLEMQAQKSFPIIVLTCRQDDESRRLARSLGVVRYLTKPFRTQELVDAVNSAIRTPAHAAVDKN